MADNFIEMQIANISKDGEMKVFSYEMELSLSAIGNSQWIIIPVRTPLIACTLEVSNNAKGKIQATTDIISRIKDGSAVGIDWDIGESFFNAQDLCEGASAIRLVQTLPGNTKISVRSQ